MIDFVVRLTSYKEKGENLEKYRHPLLSVYFFVVIVSRKTPLHIASFLLVCHLFYSLSFNFYCSYWSPIKS